MRMIGNGGQGDDMREFRLYYMELVFPLHEKCLWSLYDGVYRSLFLDCFVSVYECGHRVTSILDSG